MKDDGMSYGANFAAIGRGSTSPFAALASASTTSSAMKLFAGGSGFHSMGPSRLIADLGRALEGPKIIGYKPGVATFDSFSGVARSGGILAKAFPGLQLGVAQAGVFDRRKNLAAEIGSTVARRRALTTQFEDRVAFRSSAWAMPGTVGRAWPGRSGSTLGQFPSFLDTGASRSVVDAMAGFRGVNEQVKKAMGPFASSLGPWGANNGGSASVGVPVPGKFAEVFPRWGSASFEAAVYSGAAVDGGGAVSPSADIERLGAAVEHLGDLPEVMREILEVLLRGEAKAPDEARVAARHFYFMATVAVLGVFLSASGIAVTLYFNLVE